MNKTAEVIIIGGGVVGCAAAYYLAKKGVKDVIVLEADKSIGHGGSSRNGGGVRQSDPCHTKSLAVSPNVSVISGKRDAAASASIPAVLIPIIPTFLFS